MLSERLVRKWQCQYDNLTKKAEEGHFRSRKYRSGRQPLFQELEDVVFEWVIERSMSDC